VSDDLNELQRRQELITAAQLPPNAGLDRESAELRATWLAFGKLLEAARAGVEPPPPTLPSPLAGRRWQRPLVAITALVATVLLAVTVATHLRWGAGPAAPRSSAEMAVKSANVPPRSAVGSGNGQMGLSRPSAVSKAKPEAAASRATHLEWSDPLDEQFDRMGRTVVKVRDDSLASAAGPGLIQYQLENIRKGIDEGPF
jgi:hypothetical protein